MNGNLLSHLKLNLAGLPDRRITEKMLAAVVQPFMQEVEEVHTTIVKKMWRDVILPGGATLITLGLLLLLNWALKMGKLNAKNKYVEQFRGNDEETAAAAALELSNIDAAAEESVLEKESAKKSAPSKISQGETRSKRSLPKNSTSNSSRKRKISLILKLIYLMLLSSPPPLICLS